MCGNETGHPMENEMPSLDHADITEPLFWGTGDLLVWETSGLLQAVDHNRLFGSIWAKDSLTGEQFRQMREGTFLPVFEKLSTLIQHEALADARGFYGFFPVITDTTKLIVLDPSDFYRELIVIDIPADETCGGYRFIDFFRPEGDCIGFSAVTLGPMFAEKTARMEAAGGKEGYYLSGLGTCLLEMVVKRITTEIRRSLGILDTSGRMFSVYDDKKWMCAILPRLFETMSIEERLGIPVPGDGSLPQPFSAVHLFVRHPAVTSL